MKDDKSILGAGMGRRSFLKAAGATLAAPALASLPASVARADDVVNITFWAWTPGTDDAVAMFEKKYPNIKVNHQNVGQGGPHYQKLRDAIQAGTGLPDVAQMEFNSIPSFQALKALADMGSSGANDFKDTFVDWTWKSVSDGDKVYGIPWDSGPMGLLYRKDVFDDNKIDVPDTWDAYSEAAMKLAKNKPGTFLADFGAAPRRHVQADQQPVRPAIIVGEISEGELLPAVAHGCRSWRCGAACYTTSSTSHFGARSGGSAILICCLRSAERRRISPSLSVKSKMSRFSTI